MNKIKNTIINFVKPIFKNPLARGALLTSHVIINEKILGSYSQKGEDLIIEKLLKNKKKGFYVDVGANNPNDCSNTKRFYLKGWNGINIEPNPKNIKKFVKERPRDINLGIGISNKNGELNYFEFEEDMLSTFSKDEAQKHIHEGKKLIKKYKVRVKKLSDILKKYAKKEIDFITIDTEGFDMLVLKSNDWKKFKPKVICLESAARGYGEDYSDEFEEYLSKYGYKKIAQTRLNTIYLREIE